MQPANPRIVLRPHVRTAARTERSSGAARTDSRFGQASIHAT
jgi:hypothetical protein